MASWLVWLAFLPEHERCAINITLQLSLDCICTFASWSNPLVEEELRTENPEMKNKRIKNGREEAMEMKLEVLHEYAIPANLTEIVRGHDDDFEAWVDAGGWKTLCAIFLLLRSSNIIRSWRSKTHFFKKLYCTSKFWSLLLVCFMQWLGSYFSIWREVPFIFLLKFLAPVAFRFYRTATAHRIKFVKFLRLVI